MFITCHSVSGQLKLFHDELLHSLRRSPGILISDFLTALAIMAGMWLRVAR
jgi:hypothetical protein